MQKLKIINNNGMFIEFGMNKPYLLSHIEGLGVPPTNIYSTQHPNQDGSSVHDLLLEDRIIKVSVTIMCSNREMLYSERKKIMDVLNPKNGELTLLYTNDYKTFRIFGYLDDEVDFKKRINNNAIADITFTCSKAYWLDEKDTVKVLKYIEGGIEFPAVFPTTFAEVGYSKIIKNSGSVDTACIIEYIGSADNPTITNETTGEYIRVNKTLTNGQKLVINTAEGEETVDVVSADGTKTNVFNWLDVNSTFFKLKPGNNKIKYSSGNDTTETVIVNIVYSNKYVGV